LAGPLSQQEQANVARVYTDSVRLLFIRLEYRVEISIVMLLICSQMTTPLQQTAALLSKYQRTLPAPGQGAIYGGIAALSIKDLGVCWQLPTKLNAKRKEY